MLLVALGSTVLVVNRTLKLDHGDTDASDSQPTARASLPDGSREQQSAISADFHKQRVDSIFRVAPSSAKWRSRTHQSLPQPLVSIKAERLSVQAKDVPLEILLTQISNKSGIRITYDVLKPQSISLAFENLPLDEGLKRMLTEQDILLSYGAGRTAHTLTAVWIYPKGQGLTIQPVPPETWAATAEFEQDLSTNPDWGARTKAIEALIERKGSESLNAVLYALDDPNRNVRYSALSGALDISLALPDGTLEDLLLYDPSPYVRSLALQAISEDPEADQLKIRSMAEAALNDPIRGVQEQARDALNELEQAHRPLKRESRRSGQP
jgi:hypothetical protein